MKFPGLFLYPQQETVSGRSKEVDGQILPCEDPVELELPLAPSDGSGRRYVRFRGPK